MLHCNMNQELHLRLGLEDLLADLRHARRVDDLGRLAFIAYCEVRRWAREAGERALAECASNLITAHVPASRTRFLEQIDSLIAELDELYRGLPCSSKDLLAQLAAQSADYRSTDAAPTEQNTTVGATRTVINRSSSV